LGRELRVINKTGVWHEESANFVVGAVEESVIVNPLGWPVPVSNMGEYLERSALFGKYWRISSFVFFGSRIADDFPPAPVQWSGWLL
jgi:hypothetical protein